MAVRLYGPIANKAAVLRFFANPESIVHSDIAFHQIAVYLFGSLKRPSAHMTDPTYHHTTETF